MIIIEGMNYTGKSTLAHQIIKRYCSSYKYIHLDRPSEDFDFFWGYLQTAADTNGHCVCDRLHLSEFAYAEAEGVAPRMDDMSFHLLQAKLTVIPAMTVLLTYRQSLGGRVLLRDRHLASSKQRYHYEQLLRVNARYHNLYRPGSEMLTAHIQLDGETPWVTENTLADLMKVYSRWRQTATVAGSRKPTSLNLPT